MPCRIWNCHAQQTFELPCLVEVWWPETNNNEKIDIIHRTYSVRRERGGELTVQELNETEGCEFCGWQQLNVLRTERCCRAGFLFSWCLFLATNMSAKGFKKGVNIFRRRERDFTRNVCLICHRLLVFLHWWLQYGEGIDGSLLRGLRNSSSGGGGVHSPNMLLKLYLVFITSSQSILLLFSLLL